MYSTRLEMFRKLAEENREHLARAFRAQEVLRYAADGTGPMPVVRMPEVAPMPEPQDRPRLYVVRGAGAAALAWLFHGAFTVKAVKIGTALGLLVAALLIADMPVQRLDARPMVTNSTVAHHPAAAAHHRHHHRVTQAP